MCGADNLANPYSLSIEQDGCRHSTHAERAGQRTAIIDQFRQVNDASLGVKGIDLGHARLVLADGQNFDTFGNVRSPQRIEVRHFTHTRRTPRRPEIKNNGVARIVGQAAFLGPIFEKNCVWRRHRHLCWIEAWRFIGKGVA